MSTEVEKRKRVCSTCASCDRETWHDILCSHVDSTGDEYRIDTIHQIVQCRGCITTSFRKVVQDIESAYPVDEDEWHVPEDIYCFPSVLKGHKELNDVRDLPEMVREIYTQSVQAIKDNSNILAGIGLRATIEAICNDRNVSGRTLDKRIDGLSKAGLISQTDAERLHAIRFLGNDAAHEIKKADSKNLLIALRIIEHLLVNIYILDGEADGKLETIIKTSAQFLVLLETKLSAFSLGDEIPLAKIFGKEMRRFHGYFSTHEKYLVDQIKAGSFTKLSLGKLDVYAGSKETFQHFVVR
ncbi:DUF4145 domain-containing protein [Variovorax sp.]|uniref:DUF4145 domain-containing protein n=1 Tax=Variovorax sp. TaxID=1871043 RepID=UPI003BA8FA08